MKEVMIFLDESGHIHRNCQDRYFAIGGYCCPKENSQKIKALYKRRNKKIKEKYGLSLKEELKARNMTVEQKIELFDSVQHAVGFCGIGIVFDKNGMYRKITKENIFFNYGVRTLLDDVVFPLVDMTEKTVFHVVCDNRSIKVGDIKDLEKYLNTEFIMENCSFTVEYLNSANDYRVQLADLIVNTVYMRKHNLSLVKPVLDTLDQNSFSLSRFPGKKKFGRTDILC